MTRIDLTIAIPRGQPLQGRIDLVGQLHHAASRLHVAGQFL